MKSKIKIVQCLLLPCVLITTTSLPWQVRAEDAQKTGRPSIYDESADGSKQVADALVSAKKDGKHVLLQFGANWCGWCHKLHKLFDSDKAIAEELKNHYVVVLIDVNKEHNKETDTKYGHPTRFGLPAIVVLDSNGKQLTTQDTGKLEEGDHHDPKKVLSFLKEWAPKK
jgi:thiol:disulfide interchange protein